MHHPDGSIGICISGAHIHNKFRACKDLESVSVSNGYNGIWRNGIIGGSPPDPLLDRLCPGLCCIGGYSTDIKQNFTVYPDRSLCITVYAEGGIDVIGRLTKSKVRMHDQTQDY